METVSEAIRSDLRDVVDGRKTYDAVYQKWKDHRPLLFKQIPVVLEDYAGGKVEGLRNEIDGLVNELEKLTKKIYDEKKQVEELSVKRDELKKSIDEMNKRRAGIGENISELEDKEAEIREQIQKADDEFDLKRKTLDELKELEAQGFTFERLVKLSEEIKGISAKRGIEAKEAVRVFINDVSKSYDVKLAYKLELDRLGTEIATKRVELRKWNSKLENMKAKYSGEKATIERLKSLEKRGIGPEHIWAWNQILKKSNNTPMEFEKELKDYSSVRELAEGWKNWVDRLKKDAAKLNAEIQTLEERKEEIEVSIESLTKAGLNEIRHVRTSAESEIQKLCEDAKENIKCAGEREVEVAKRVGELRAVENKIAEEIRNAGYFVRLPMSQEALDRFVDDINPIVVQQYLAIFLTWFKKKSTLESGLKLKVVDVIGEILKLVGK